MIDGYLVSIPMGMEGESKSKSIPSLSTIFDSSSMRSSSLSKLIAIILIKSHCFFYVVFAKSRAYDSHSIVNISPIGSISLTPLSFKNRKKLNRFALLPYTMCTSVLEWDCATL